MVYKKYGEVFKILRKQHDLKLSDFEHLGISKGTLSQFENGKTLLSFDKLESALELMHVMMSAYILTINNGVSEYYLTQFIDIDKASIQKDEAKLKEIEKRNLIYEESCAVSLAARANYTELSVNQLNEVEEYLKNCRIWSRYELYILVNTLGQINDQLFLNIIDSLFENDEYYYLRERQEFKHLLARILVKGGLKLIKKENEEESKRLLRYLCTLPNDLELTEKIAYMFLEGCWLYKFRSINSGEKIVRNCLKTLSDISAFEFRTLMKKEYEELKQSI